MSRIGRKPVEIPRGVEVKIDNTTVTVKGPRGILAKTFSPRLKITAEDNHIIVTPLDSGRKTRALHGLTRTLIANMVEGVTKGFARVLEINGVGYKAQVQGRTLILNIGFSNPVNYPLPEGVDVKVDRQTIVTITGIDKELVGQTAANIRGLRPPDPYKAKGIKYRDEIIRRKAGKTGR